MSLKKIFETTKSLTLQTKSFLKRVNGYIHQRFKKVKIYTKKDHQLEDLYNKRRYLRTKEDQNSKEELEQLEEKLAQKYSESMYKKIKHELKAMNGEEGGYNPGHLWKLKKKLSPQQRDTPTTMKDESGKLLTTTDEIVKEAQKHYRKVVEQKPIEKGLEAHQIQREALCEERLKIASQNKTPMWTPEDVRIAIKSLNIGISKDPYGIPNEILKEGIAGNGLIKALVVLMNKIKDNPKDYPEAMNLCNVTSIYKNKGDRNKFDSHRGVFRTTFLRNLLDRLIYNDKYKNVDENLTDCNVGSRRRRNIRDNLFVMNALMNASQKGHNQPCDINVYDVRKCFDFLWLMECINDLFESGLNNDKLNILYYSNINAQIAVKTSNGVSEKFNIQKVVMQGTVWAGLMCTTTMDKLGKQFYANPNMMYKYRSEALVPPLQMVDDVICASKCGNQVITSNAAITMFAKLKKLELSETKCARIHIGKNKCDQCAKICVNGIEIKE